MGLLTYSLLGELTGTLVAGVAEQLNNAALVGGETGHLLDDVLYNNVS